MSESELELYGIIGKMFRELRESKGYSSEFVAEHLSITPRSLQRYECGERKINMGAIKDLCRFYNLNYDEFIKEAKKRFTRNDEFELDDKPQSSYYFNDDAREMAEFMFKNPEYKVLFDASRKVKKEDIEFVKQMIDRMSGDTGDSGC